MYITKPASVFTQRHELWVTLSCSTQSNLHFLSLSRPCLMRRPDYHAPSDGGAHREGVQHPGEEVEGVQRGADTPARPPPPRYQGHLRVQTPCRLHQLRWQLLFLGKPDPSTRTPQGLLQPPVTPWLPQVQGSFPLSNEEGLLLRALRNGLSVPTCSNIKPGTRRQP